MRNLRWWIGGLLFASTVINYIDRQMLSLLAPDLKRIYHWTNSDYAALGIAFRIAYSIGQTVFGRVAGSCRNEARFNRDCSLLLVDFDTDFAREWISQLRCISISIGIG